MNLSDQANYFERKLTKAFSITLINFLKYLVSFLVFQIGKIRLILDIHSFWLKLSLGKNLFCVYHVLWSIFVHVKSSDFSQYIKSGFLLLGNCSCWCLHDHHNTVNTTSLITCFPPRISNCFDTQESVSFCRTKTFDPERQKMKRMTSSYYKKYVSLFYRKVPSQTEIKSQCTWIKTIPSTLLPGRLRGWFSQKIFLRYLRWSLLLPLEAKL